MEQPQNIARKDDKMNPLESCDRGAIFDGHAGPVHTVANDIVVVRSAVSMLCSRHRRKGHRRGERRRNGEDTEQIRRRSKGLPVVKDVAAMHGNIKVMI